MTHLVSIVIPTYNRAADLRRALESVRAQTYADWEAVVVDNHSTDATSELIESLGDSRIWMELIHNDGIIAASRNRGIAKANGTLIAFLDSDDWWTKDKLAETVAAFEAGADIAYHELFVVRRPGQRRLRPTGSVRQVVAPVFDDLFYGGNALANSGVVVRADLLRAIGPLCEDRNLVGMEDFDSWLRLARLTDNFTMLESPLGYYWAGGGNMTNPERTLRALDAFRTMHADEMNSSERRMPWIEYARARALFRLRDYPGARAELARLQLLQLPASLAAKTAYMRVVAGLAR